MRDRQSALLRATPSKVWTKAFRLFELDGERGAEEEA